MAARNLMSGNTSEASNVRWSKWRRKTEERDKYD